MGRQEGRNKVGLLLRQRRIVLAVGVGCGQDFGVGAADGHRSGLSSRDLVGLFRTRMMVVARPVICRMRAMPRTAAAVPASPRRYGRAARLMRARRAAESPAVPAGSARGAIGAVAHRGEDPPHDGGVPAGSVRRVVIIRSPGRRTRRASRGSLGGFAFDDSHDVEGSHVRHDPPSPRPAQGREPRPPPWHPRPDVARPGANYRRWHRRIFLLPVQSRQRVF
jgi:hypothetical protein